MADAPAVDEDDKHVRRLERVRPIEARLQREVTEGMGLGEFVGLAIISADSGAKM
jgi:hypothetical protein